MYKVNEIFFSIQGEGARFGTRNVFVRFSDCNLTCSFCDTEFLSGKNMSASEIILEIEKYNTKNVIFTGGEPLLQVDDEICQPLKNKGYFIAVETNGSIKPGTALIDYVACSPKVAEHVVKKIFPNGVSELRYVIHPGKELPQPKVVADNYFLSPVASGDFILKDSINHCIDLIKLNDSPHEWRLSLQQHKIIGVR